MKLKTLFAKYKSVIAYLFFGGCTTVLNVAVYWLCYDVGGWPNTLSTVLAWVVAVAFAFVTNKLFVFESKSWQPSLALKEAGNFFLCRVGTGLLELGLMYLFVDVLQVNGTLMKLITNVVVIILNYVASKLFIFTKK